MYTIKDLSKGKCAVENDGTLKELREVLKLAFPLVPLLAEASLAGPMGEFKYYLKNENFIDDWYPGDSTSLPVQSVKDFLVEEDVFKVGDLVRCVGSCTSTGDYIDKGIGWELNREFKIESINDRYPSQAVSGGGVGVYFHALELVEKPMTTDELLAEAKRRYPVGTRFKCVTNRTNSFIKAGHKIITSIHEVKELVSVGERGVYTKSGGWVIFKGEWAEIVSSPVPELEEKVIKTIITKEYLNQKNVAFHCETQEEAVWLDSVARLHGMTDPETLHSYYDRQPGIHDLADNCFKFRSGTFGTSPVYWYKSRGDKIIKVSSILNLNNKEDGSTKENSRNDVQRINVSIRGDNRSRKPRFTSTESEIRNRGGFSRKRKRPSFSQTETI